MKRSRSDLEKILDEHFKKLKNDLIEFFQNDEAEPPQQEEKTRGFTSKNQTSRDIPMVVISADGSVKSVKVDKNGKDEFLKKTVGGGVEYHLTAYAVREGLPEHLQKPHENICIACDDEGYYKKLPTNKKASTITGLHLFGTIVFFIEEMDEETEEVFYAPIDEELVEELYQHTKD